MLSPGSLLQTEWYKTREGQDMLAPLFHRDGFSRKTFGLLERPSYPPSNPPEEVTYKLFLVGKSSVGKTSTVCKLGGYSIPTTHSETPGVQVSTVYWPAKITQLNKVFLFKLQLWDAGENSLKKFDHILSSCTDKTDGILFLFSFIDKGSFEELPQFLTKLTNPGDNLCKIVLGTKFDQHAHSEVTQRDIRDFESTWNIPILRIKNVPYFNQTEAENEVSELVPILNTICEHLWYRDIVTAQQEKAYF
ncbi:hypothetical protein SNE40_015164 [Patella caerulea]|uniref:Ciliogenesis and planar polarity effector 2 n=1 Tax=Patella caerulea TaxID=87958 RepID=A0AAN8PRP3_PATCE